jgi:hypothetical protein
VGAGRFRAAGSRRLHGWTTRGKMARISAELAPPSARRSRASFNGDFVLLSGEIHLPRRRARRGAANGPAPTPPSAALRGSGPERMLDRISTAVRHRASGGLTSRACAVTLAAEAGRCADRALDLPMALPVAERRVHAAATAAHREDGHEYKRRSASDCFDAHLTRSCCQRAALRRARDGPELERRVLVCLSPVQGAATGTARAARAPCTSQPKST